MLNITQKTLCTLTCLIALTLNVSAQNFNEIIKAVASDRGANDNFGISVSISGDYAIVGTWGEAEDSSGGNTLSGAGSAYLFERDTSGNWAEKQKIVASDREVDDYFGRSVFISGDYAVVGAYGEDEDTNGINTLSGAGSAYLFERNSNGNWAEKQKLIASDRGVDDNFGHSVSISGDYVIVGASSESEDDSGANTLSSSGSAYLFERDASGYWAEKQKIVASDRGTFDYFGVSVSISGDYAIVGAFGEDHDISGVNLLSGAGSAYLFERDTSGIWAEKQKIVASDRGYFDYFGRTVSISGDYAIVGAVGEEHDISGANTLPDAGSAYLFERDTSGIWAEKQKIVASDRGSGDKFSASVSISEDYALIGAVGEDHDTSGANTLSDAGSAYLFERDTSGNWAEKQKIVASDRGVDDYFGLSVSISGDFALIGALREDEDDSSANTLSDAGSVYLFGFCYINTSVTNNSTKLTANQAGATYQWIDCSTSTAMIGDTNQTFTATTNGAFKVAITMNSCTDTSTCQVVTGIGVVENDFGNTLLLYPNPTSGSFYVAFKNRQENVTVNILSLSGQLIQTKKFQNSSLIHLDIDEPKGLYLIEITNSNGYKTMLKITKE